MRIEPIPKALLNCNVIYRPFVKEERNGGVWGDEVFVEHVCVDEKSTYSVGGGNQSVSCKAVVYYDCANSKPLGIVFREKDVLIYNGNELVVESVIKPNWNMSGVHHYELRCN